MHLRKSQSRVLDRLTEVVEYTRPRLHHSLVNVDETK